MRDQINTIIEAGCAGFYESPDGLTDWSRFSSLDPQLADRYRESVRRSIIRMADTVDRDELANIGARALHEYGGYVTPFEGLPEHQESWRAQAHAIVDAIFDSLTEAAG